MTTSPFLTFCELEIIVIANITGDAAIPYGFLRLVCNTTQKLLLPAKEGVLKKPSTLNLIKPLGQTASLQETRGQRSSD